MKRLSIGLLCMLALPSWSVQIFVSGCYRNQTIVIEVDLDDTIHDLKERIYEKTAIPTDLQNLYYCSKQLVDEKTVQTYDIGKESTIRLFIKTNGP